MAVLGMVAHPCFKLLPTCYAGIGKSLFHQRPQGVHLVRFHAQVTGQVAGDLVEYSRGPMQAKAPGRGGTQQGVAQHHREQHVCVEDRSWYHVGQLRL